MTASRTPVVAILGATVEEPPPGIDPAASLAELRYAGTADEVPGAIAEADAVFSWGAPRAWLRDAFPTAAKLRWVQSASDGVQKLLVEWTDYGSSEPGAPATGSSASLHGRAEAGTPVAPPTGLASRLRIAGHVIPQRPTVEQRSQQIEQHGVIAPLHGSSSRQPRSSNASQIRSRLFHQITGGMPLAA